MGLPARVQEQADKARARQEAHIKSGAPDGEDTGNEPAPDVSKHQDAPNRADPKDEQIESLRLQLESSRNAFTTLTGKFNAEVPRLAAELRVLKDQVAVKDAEIEKLKGAKPANADISLESLGITDDEQERFGPELLKLAARMAKKIASDTLPAAKPAERATPAAEPKPDDAAKSPEHDPALYAKYEATLERMVPNFKETNSDDLFIAWLKKADPKSGRSRMAVLQEAHGDRDAYTVAEVFRSFRENREIGSPPSSLDRHIDPGGGQGDPPRNQPKGRIWKQSEISQFYKDKSLGIYKGRDKEARELENDIFAAQTAGRIRPG